MRKKMSAGEISRFLRGLHITATPKDSPMEKSFEVLRDVADQAADMIDQLQECVEKCGESVLAPGNWHDLQQSVLNSIARYVKENAEQVEKVKSEVDRLEQDFWFNTPPDVPGCIDAIRAVLEVGQKKSPDPKKGA